MIGVREKIRLAPCEIGLRRFAPLPDSTRPNGHWAQNWAQSVRAASVAREPFARFDPAHSGHERPRTPSTVRNWTVTVRLNGAQPRQGETPSFPPFSPVTARLQT
jgi:hypothetical protein